MDEKENQASRDKLEEEKSKRRDECKHTKTKKEKIKGQDTGDVTCCECGESFWVGFNSK